MRFQDLSPENQALVNTDFGPLDKVAEEQVKIASEMYSSGAEMAQATADQVDKLAAEKEEEEEEKEEKEEMGEAEKKASEDYGIIIAEGFTDKLASLGEERYGDADHYFIPFMEEKVAAAGARAAVKKFWEATKKRVGESADRHVEGAKKFRSGVTGTNHHDPFGKFLAGGKKHTARGERRGLMLEGAKKMAPGAAVLTAGTGAGIYAATRKKKEEAPQ